VAFSKVVTMHLKKPVETEHKTFSSVQVVCAPWIQIGGETG